MKKRILIIDSFCTEPYDAPRLAAGALGGTEATVVRVAEGLGKLAHVTVAQKARQTAWVSDNGVRYTPFDAAHVDKLPRADVVILLRAPKLLPMLRKRYPAARLLLWLHCYQGKHRKWLNTVCVQTDTTIVAVSETHAEWMRHFLHRYRMHGRNPSLYRQATVRAIYNPVVAACQPAQSDPDKLIFFSSPHKGLDQVLRHFERVVAFRPKTTLYLANPGYIDLPDNLSQQNIVMLGALKQEEVVQHVAEAFCVFYPQTFFAETFGLVFAEANAVGTPVLTHDIGSAAEILDDPDQIVDAHDGDAVVARLRDWWGGNRPIVQGNPQFKPDAVVKQWQTFLDIPDAPPQKDIPFTVSLMQPSAQARLRAVV